MHIPGEKSTVKREGCGWHGDSQGGKENQTSSESRVGKSTQGDSLVAPMARWVLVKLKSE